MGNSRKLDASQRQELAWLLDEADSAIEPWLQTEEVRWPEVLITLVARLRLCGCGFEFEADGIASDVQTTPKIGKRGGPKNSRELRQHRQRVVERVRKRIAAIRNVIATATNGGGADAAHPTPADAQPQDGGNGQDAAAASGDKPKRALPKMPSKEAWAAYYLWQCGDGLTQEQIVKRLAQKGIATSQPSVHRMIKACDTYLAADGLAPTPEELAAAPDPRQAVTMDPAILDIGGRQDGLTPRQRDRFDDDE